MMLQSDLPPPQQERHILRRPEVGQKTGLKRSYLYHVMNLSKFPKPIRIGVRAVVGTPQRLINGLPIVWKIETEE